jgi:CRP-like cAMP-binding protein
MIKGYTHQDFSEMLGTYRETVTQTLNEFKSDGLIDTGRKQVRLLDYGRLQQMAAD